MDEHGGREHGRAWRPRAWTSMEAVSMGAASARRGRMGAVSFMTIPTSCAAGRALGKTGQDWASLGAGDQANSERSSGACVGHLPSMAVSREQIFAAHMAQRTFSRNVREGPGTVAGRGQYHLQQRPRLACRAVPCCGGRRGCLSPFYVDFLGDTWQHVGQHVFFWDSLRLTPATWQGA